LITNGGNSLLKIRANGSASDLRTGACLFHTRLTRIIKVKAPAPYGGALELGIQTWYTVFNPKALTKDELEIDQYVKIHIIRDSVIMRS